MTARASLVTGEAVQTEKVPETRVCLVCRNEANLMRRGVRGDPERPVFLCPACQLQFIDPPADDLREYYRSQYRAAHEATIGRPQTPEERYILMRPHMWEIAARFKKDVPPGGSLLEIGCSSGYLLDAIGPKYDRFGCEWNPDDAAYVRDVGDMPCEEGEIADIYPDKVFNAIVAVQVLEHQADPVQFLKDCKERLIGGGYLYLELPNAWDAMVTVYQNEAYRNFWYREPHITYWTRETLASVLGSLHFEASVRATQRYGLMNHVNWSLHGAPMEDVDRARGYLSWVHPDHPLAGVMNRSLNRLDKEYRTILTTYGCADTMYAICRRRDI
jgi:SAM-dependent methyltransferase